MTMIPVMGIKKLTSVVKNIQIGNIRSLMKKTMSKPSLTFSEYCTITESIDLDVGQISRDVQLEQMVKQQLPAETHESVQVTYNQHMDNNNLRLIKFKNPEGQIEYHIHNTSMMPGLKSGNVSKLGFMSVAKMIHDDGAKEIAAGNPLRFQSVEGSPQHAKYVNVIERIAKKAGREVQHAGIHPITSAPFLRGEVMIVQ